MSILLDYKSTDAPSRAQPGNPTIRDDLDKRRKSPDTAYSNTTYAVRLVPASCQTRKLFSPAAAWYYFIFCTNMWLSEPHVRAKDLVSSALPEAISASKRVPA